MTPDQEREFGTFNLLYKIIKTSIFSLPRRNAFKGDCQTYARNIRRILNVKPWEAVVWRCWSPQNKWWWPRHAVIWVKGYGWIDSTKREFRDKPDPHTRLWPVGTPAIVWLIYSIGVFQGWWSTLNIFNVIGWFL
jgi:hypothetical protein